MEGAEEGANVLAVRSEIARLRALASVDALRLAPSMAFSTTSLRQQIEEGEKFVAQAVEEIEKAVGGLPNCSFEIVRSLCMVVQRTIYEVERARISLEKGVESGLGQEKGNISGDWNTVERAGSVISVEDGSSSNGEAIVVLSTTSNGEDEEAVVLSAGEVDRNGSLYASSDDDGVSGDLQSHPSLLPPLALTARPSLLKHTLLPDSFVNGLAPPRPVVWQRLASPLWENQTDPMEDKDLVDSDVECEEILIEGQPRATLPSRLSRVLKPHQVEGVQFLWSRLCPDSPQPRGCVLGDAMGLGKTLQIIAFLELYLFLRPTTSVLIVCPAVVAFTWQREFSKWLGPSRGAVFAGRVPLHIEPCVVASTQTLSARHTIVQRWEEKGGVLLISYELFRNATGLSEGLDSAVREVDSDNMRGNPLICPDIIVLDEGHRIRHLDSGVSQALNAVQSARRVVVTGYPLQNNLTEYWCMFHFACPDVLGSLAHFRFVFQRVIETGFFSDSDEYQRERAERRIVVLYRTLKSHVLRRGAPLLANSLPVKHEYVIFVQMSSLQWHLFHALLSSRLWTYADVITFCTVATWICNHPDILIATVAAGESGSRSGLGRQTGGPGSDQHRRRHRAAMVESFSWVAPALTACGYSPGMVENGLKMVIVMGLLEEAWACGDKTVIFSQSLATLDHLQRMLDAHNSQVDDDRRVDEGSGVESRQSDGVQERRVLRYLRFDGATPAAERQQMIDGFSAPNSRVAVFLISTRAGGEGVSLVAANRVIILDTSWNPSHDSEAACRVYRYGQRKPVTVYRFIVSGSVEDFMYQQSLFKQALFARVVEEQPALIHEKEKLPSYFSLPPRPPSPCADEDGSGLSPELEDSVLGAFLSRSHIARQAVCRIQHHGALVDIGQVEAETTDEDEVVKATLEVEQDRQAFWTKEREKAVGSRGSGGREDGGWSANVPSNITPSGAYVFGPLFGGNGVSAMPSSSFTRDLSRGQDEALGVRFASAPSLGYLNLLKQIGADGRLSPHPVVEVGEEIHQEDDIHSRRRADTPIPPPPPDTRPNTHSVAHSRLNVEIGAMAQRRIDAAQTKVRRRSALHGEKEKGGEAGTKRPKAVTTAFVAVPTRVVRVSCVQHQDRFSRDDERALRALFQPFGAVENIVVGPSQHAYVTFESRTDAESALNYGRLHYAGSWPFVIDSRLLRVSWAMPRYDGRCGEDFQVGEFLVPPASLRAPWAGRDLANARSVSPNAAKTMLNGSAGNRKSGDDKVMERPSKTAVGWSDEHHSAGGEGASETMLGPDNTDPFVRRERTDNEEGGGAGAGLAGRALQRLAARGVVSPYHAQAFNNRVNVIRSRAGPLQFGKRGVGTLEEREDGNGSRRGLLGAAPVVSGYRDGFGHRTDYREREARTRDWVAQGRGLLPAPPPFPPPRWPSDRVFPHSLPFPLPPFPIAPPLPHSARSSHFSGLLPNRHRKYM